MKLSILLLTAMALLTVPMVVCAADDTPVLVPSLVVGLRHSQNQKPCELGWNFQKFHGGDLGASAGTGFSWMMIPDNPTADPAARHLPAGIVLALRHSTNQSDPRLTAFGHDPVTGPQSLPGLRRQSGGDRGAPSGQGYYWYEATGANTTPADFAIIDKLPKGTIVGLKHSLNQQGKTFSWHGVTYDAANPNLPAPRGFTRMAGGDLKAPAGQGYYWYQKVTCPCSPEVGVGTCVSNGADPFDKLPESIDGTAKALAVVFDFDTDSCYPSPAVSRLGKQNGGLKASGPLTGQCRERAQLTNANTYYRKKCIAKESVTYCVHMYALYFMKDQSYRYPPAGHRHDWEFALLWTRNGELTHASHSEHKDVVTKPRAELHFDPGKENTVKIVYHKSGLHPTDLQFARTHAFRFAKQGERAENHLKRWITPTLVDWQTMTSDNITNQVLRKKFNQFDYGKATCSFNDTFFENRIAQAPPAGYPF